MIWWILWVIVGLTLYVFLKNGTCFFENLFGHSKFFEFLNRKQEVILCIGFAIVFPGLFLLLLLDKPVIKPLLGFLRRR